MERNIGQPALVALTTASASASAVGLTGQGWGSFGVKVTQGASTEAG